MNIHKIIKERFTQLEALGLTIVVFGVIIFSMLFIVVSTSETVRNAMKTLLRKVEKKKVKQKPVIMAKKIPVNIPKAPPIAIHLAQVTSHSIREFSFILFVAQIS